MVAMKKVHIGDEAKPGASLPPREEISAHHLIDETRLLGGLVERAVYTEDERRRSAEIARRLVIAARANRSKHSGIDAFMKEYGLSSEEGVILMCLAEALLRIPDSETADRFIAEKLAGGQWERHRGHSDSLFVNASTWALMLTGRLVKHRDAKNTGALESLKRLVARSGEPVVRQAIRQAVRILGDQFVLGRTIGEAISRAEPYEERGYRFSYDMLGEAARAEADARRYFDRYMAAIEAIGAKAGRKPSHHDQLVSRPGISVKLSALHARFEPGKQERLAAELNPRLLTLLKAAEQHGLNVTIDAEEQDRLEPTLDSFGAMFVHASLANWHGLGIAVQAYGKRAVPVLRWLRRLSERTGKRIPLRLVKGAYWDSEIKLAQERGLADYPVLTRKLSTDVSYLACMRLVLSDAKAFLPQFATHNAHTVAAAYVSSGQAEFEYQRLHGMGEALYEEVVGPDKLARPCRIYAPVGDHEDLLGYLVRRILENGANTSFVNRLADDEAPITQIIRDPIDEAERERTAGGTSEKLLSRPREIFWPERKNSSGLPLSDAMVCERLVVEMEAALKPAFEAGPVVKGEVTAGGPSATLVTSPHDRRQRMGSVRHASPVHIEAAIETAVGASHGWDRLGGPARARILEHAADLFERDRVRLMAVLVREAGKTLPNALSEVREAADFLRYYAHEARRLFGGPQTLKSATGETNTLELRGRGVFAAISPWNFPLAIFTGQVAAALAAGNTVVAKPAEQTPITGFLAVQLLLEAGVPREVLQYLPGPGGVGAVLVKDPRVKGVVFTGSNETAWLIQKALAERRGEIVPLIAETGGLNAMIADSSALPEQVVRDCVRSAFDSAGQRCSAARVLFVQSDIAERTIRMLSGAIEALDLGDPFDIATDIGPVIDEPSQDEVDAHKMQMQSVGRELVDMPMPVECRVGCYVTPAAYEIGALNLLAREVFGPVLHVVRFERGHLDRVVAAINASGFGLTLGLHSRIASVADFVAEHARVGNLYVNRNQIGAVPGVQPFGGDGLSGTGPKAGGPNYLVRFATERVRTTDITATGGNVQLLTHALPSED